MKFVFPLIAFFAYALTSQPVEAQHIMSADGQDITGRNVHVDNSTEELQLLALAADPNVIINIADLDPERIPKNIKGAVNFNAHSGTFSAPHLETVGNINAHEATSLELPALKSAGEIWAESAETLDAPNLQSSGRIDADRTKNFNAPKLKTSGTIVANCGIFPELETSGSLFCGQMSNFSAPKLRDTEGIYASNATTFIAPLLKHSGTIGVPKATSLDAPSLETSGPLNADSATQFNAPKLREAKGVIYADTVTALNIPNLEASGDLHAKTATKIDVPQLQAAGNISADNVTDFIVPKLRYSGDISLGHVTKFNIPVLETAGNITANNIISFDAPSLQTSGAISVSGATSFNAPYLRTSKDITDSNATVFRVPELQRVMGDIRLEKIESFDAPILEIAGDIHAESASHFDAPRLKSAGQITAATSVTPQIQHKCPPELIEQYVKNKEFGVALQIIARHDSSVLPQLEPLLTDKKVSVRTTTAYIFAALGDQRGFDAITAVINDHADKPEYHPDPHSNVIMDVAGAPSVAQDRFFAVHMLGDLKDKRSVPLLVSLLDDDQVNYLVPWTLGEIGGDVAQKGLLQALKNKNPDVRVTAIETIAKIGYRVALPNLRSLLDDPEKSHFGRLATVSEAAQSAISKLEMGQ